MNPLVFFPAMSIALIIILSINYYLARRSFQCISYSFPKIPSAATLIIFAILTFLLCFGFVRSMLPVSEKVKYLLAVVSSYYMGFFLYFFMYTLLTDMVILVLRLCKIITPTMTSLRFISGIIVICLTLATTGYGIYNATQLKVVKYDVTADKPLEHDWNIVMISDLHLGSVTSEKKLDKIVNEINSLNPDIICIAGDFFDSDFYAIQNPEKATDTLRQLQSKYGTYVCLGNHDAGNSFPQMAEFLEQSNIHALNDSYTLLQNKLILAGRLDSSPIGGYGGTHRKSTDEFMADIDTSLPVVVLDHNPMNISEYTGEVDLILCGHTHKGQIFPGSIITNAMYEVDYGYYRRNNDSPQVIVSSGVGFWGMPMRVGTDCEIVQINLHS